jgi:hypothetical protein
MAIDSFTGVRTCSIATEDHTSESSWRSSDCRNNTAEATKPQRYSTYSVVLYGLQLQPSDALAVYDGIPLHR